MEIHPPHGSIHTWKDFLIQLGTITAGVLIALSFEGLREWRHERALVREARETIAREIADNLKEIETGNADIGKRQANIDQLIGLADAVLNKKPSEIHEITVGYAIADLNAAGWQTAERMGALAHMDYAEAQRYAHVYGIQQLFAEHQRRALEHATSALVLLRGNPFDAPPTNGEVLLADFLSDDCR